MKLIFSLITLPLVTLSLPHSFQGTVFPLKAAGVKTSGEGSIVLPEGVEFILYQDNNGDGASWSNSAQNGCLRIPDEMNRQTSSLSLRSGGCISLYANEDCSGPIRFYCYNSREIINISQDDNDKASSVHRCSYQHSPIPVKNPCEIY